MARLQVIPGLDPARYARHALHAEDNTWVEKNCYIDIWIELLHALGLEPTACLAFTLAIDFEGDQWTFFKPSHTELWQLYGIDVQELNVWRPLIDHALEHLAAGRLISTEADAWWLPDTAGTDYRRAHTKTTIVLNDLDVEAGRLGYFHNAGYHELSGEDFQRTFRIGAEPDPAFMPLFAEVVRTDRVVRRPPAELAALSLPMLRSAVERMPARNPMPAYVARFAQDLEGIRQRGLAYYHAWAFATTRQLGAASELAARYLRWLHRHAGCEHEAAAQALDAVSATCKAFILKGARAAASGKAPGLDDLASQLGAQWLAARDALRA
jgi:hypothetical protein